MGITKSDIYTEEQNQVAAYAKVLGHPARIAIIQELVERKTCVCGDLVNEIGLAQATISQHLKELKQAELIQGEVEGTSVCYCINTKKWNELKKMFDCFFGSVNDSKKDTYITHIHNDNRQVHFHDANLQQTEVQEHHHK